MGELEEMRREMGKLKGHIISQGEELLRLKRATGEEGSHLGSKRLKDIECELGEQRKSTDKITKLCLAAIKALETLEKRSPGVDFSSLEERSCQGSVESVKSNSSVGADMVKTMCEQLDVINKLLVKVDDDIEGVDEKAESALADFELLDKRMVDMERKVKETKDTLMGEVRALLVSKTYATREDLSRALAQAQQQKQVGVTKEEVSSMIERATSNFLRTVHADTAHCTEQSQACEERLNKELHTLGSRLQDTDSRTRADAKQIQESSERNIKEVTRTLAGLVEQHRTKAGTESAEAFNRINRRVDNEVKNFTEMVKEVKDLGLKGADESKQQSRLESLGKEVTALKADQAKVAKTVEGCVTQHTGLESQTKGISRSLEQQAASLEQLAKLGRQKERAPSQNREDTSKLVKLDTQVTFLESQNQKLTRKYELHNEEMTKQKEEVAKQKEEFAKQKEEFAKQKEEVAKQKEEVAKLAKQPPKVVVGEEVGKLGRLENSLSELGQRLDSTGRLADTLVQECSRKVDKTELDDIRNGMEKERCKINYFQDKILNIAKVAEAARADTTSLKDKVTAEVGGLGGTIQAVTTQVERQGETIRDNSEALRGITKDSIGKIKEVASNCVQIEANIRSIRDKSVIFDNELKQIKDKISQTEYKLEEGSGSGAKEIKKMMKEKEDEIRRLVNGMEEVKKKVQQNMMELGNFKEDRRTKEGENEERQLSLEQNLLDVRTYVERMLQETNRQLTGVAGEVEAADRKIARCSTDIVDLLDRQEHSSSGSSTAVSSLEAAMKELQEQETMRRVEWAGELLEIKGSSADSQTEVLTKMEAMVEAEASLRRDTATSLQKLENTVSQLSDGGGDADKKAAADLAALRDSLDGRLAGIGAKVTGLEGKLGGLSQGQVGQLKDTRDQVQTCTDSMMKVHLKVDGLMAAEEKRATQVRSVQECLGRLEREAGVRREEDSVKVALIREELQGSVRSSEAARKEVDNRVENMRRNMIEMIGVNENKTAEMVDKLGQTSDAVRDLKIVTSNIATAADNKVKVVKDDLEKLVNDKIKVKSPATLDLEKAFAGLRKEVEQVRTDLRNNDLDSFKNIVNSTNDTHNKLISSIQKNLDLVLREKGQQEEQAAAVEEKIAKIAVLREAGEKEVLSLVAKEQELRQQVDEKVLSLQLSLRAVQGGVEGLPQLQAGLASLRESVGQARKELEASVTQQQDKMHELQELLNSELKNVKVSMTSSGQSLHQAAVEEFSQVSRTIQEKSALADTKLNESLDLLHSHTRQIESLQETAETVAKSSETSEAQLQKVEFKVKSCVEEMAKLDQYAKVTELRKLEKTVGEKPGSVEAAAVQDKLAKLSAETINSLRDLGQKQSSLGLLVTGVQAEVARLSDMTGLTEDVAGVSDKVAQQKAKLIDMEASVSQQERSTAKLSEDLKKLGSSVTETVAKVEEKLDKMDGAKKELTLKMADVEKVSSGLGQELASLTGLKTKAPTWDRKAESSEVVRLNSLLTEEVNKIQEEMKDILKKSEEAASSMASSMASKKEPAVVEPQVSQEQFDKLQLKYTTLSELIETFQGRLTSQQDSSSEQLEQVHNHIRGLKTGLATIQHESKKSGALGMIDKQRRGWEDAMEKAEQMSQIFDSLIITNDRPYVSCGLESPATCPGLVDFQQFELINKVGWDAQDLMFTMLEPGVYMLQMGGSISGANVVAKMVNEDVEAEVVTLEGGKEIAFRHRSTIFTVEDDDNTAERLLVEVVEQGEDCEVRLAADFQLLLHKISEVSQAEGPECLAGEFVKS